MSFRGKLKRRNNRALGFFRKSKRSGFYQVGRRPTIGKGFPFFMGGKWSDLHNQNPLGSIYWPTGGGMRPAVMNFTS